MPVLLLAYCLTTTTTTRQGDTHAYVNVVYSVYYTARARLAEQLVRANIFRSSQPNYFLNMRAYWSPSRRAHGWLTTKLKMIIVILPGTSSHAIREITPMRRTRRLTIRAAVDGRAFLSLGVQRPPRRLIISGQRTSRLFVNYFDSVNSGVPGASRTTRIHSSGRGATGRVV